MKLGIMQPYFFPYLGHFALIAAVDEWVVFDLTQYTRRSWLSRNRILRPGGGWRYVSVPLKNSSTHIRTCEAAVADLGKTEQLVRGKLSHYRRRAPHYAAVCELVGAAFADVSDEGLVALDVSALRAVCAYLGLPFRYRVCSHLPIDFPCDLRAGQWAPWISAKLSADVYVNPIGGRALFHPPDFSRRQVGLQLLDYTPFVYETPGYTFEKDLSILDVLMWNDPGAVVRAIGTNSSLITVQA
jgi:hypothetical protein